MHKIDHERGDSELRCVYMEVVEAFGLDRFVDRRDFGGLTTIREGLTINISVNDAVDKRGGSDRDCTKNSVALVSQQDGVLGGSLRSGQGTLLMRAYERSWDASCFGSRGRVWDGGVRRRAWATEPNWAHKR